MGFNGQGDFLFTTFGQPFVYDTEIDQNVVNNVLLELETALSNTVCCDGQSVITQDIPFNGFSLKEVGAGSSAQDAVNVQSIVNQTYSYAVSVGGTGDAITATPAVTISAYGTGMRLTFKAGATNTGAVTINVGSLGVKSVLSPSGSALVAGDIVSGQLIDIQYNGTDFWMMRTPYSQGSWTVSVGGTATYTNQIGRWTRIGRTVHISGQLAINTIGTGSTSVLSGLPFTAANIGIDFAIGVGDFSTLATNVVWLGAKVNANAATITLRNLTAAGASATSSALLGNGSSVTFGGTYIL